MKKLILFIPLFLSVCAGAETLTLDQCVDAAVRNNPSLAGAQKSLSAAGERVWQSASVFFPTVNASGNFGRSRQEDPFNNSLFGYSNNLSAGFSASMPVFTFGRNYYTLSAQKYTYKASQYDYDTQLNQLVFNVTKAYYNVVYAQKNVSVLQDSVKQSEEHLKQAQAFYDVGVKPKIDVTNAQVNLNMSKLNLITAQNSVTNAYAALNNLMGAKDLHAQYDVIQDVEFSPYEISLDDALERALQDRPDFLSAQARTTVASKSLNELKTENLPTVSASASYGWSGSDSLSRESGSVGLNASMPIFNGFKNTSRVREAGYNYDAAQLNQESVRQNVIMDVTQTVSNLQEAQNRVPVAKQTAESAEENFNLAQGRYKVGIGNNIEVIDAENSFMSASLQYASALTDYRTAIADVRRAMGTK